MNHFEKCLANSSDNCFKGIDTRICFESFVAVHFLKKRERNTEEESEREGRRGRKNERKKARPIIQTV